MEIHELEKILSEALALPAENEIVEFKEAKNNFDSSKIGEYFSALSNEANLKEKPCAWLIFGINDKHQIVGSDYRLDRKKLDSLKKELGDLLTNNISFTAIHVLCKPEGRVIMFQIPAASQGIPVAFKGHYYGRLNESLVALNIQKIESIRNQVLNKDWSREIVSNVTIDVLDKNAISKARQKFKEAKEHRAIADEVDTWSDETFLDKANVTIDGKITNAAIILLGKPKSAYHISPAVAQITWKLDTEEQAYQHFETPFLLTVNDVLKRIRNVAYKFFPNTQLVGLSVDKYSSEVILEALNNCIAHQDYRKNSRIILTEQINKLIFENAGDFIEGTPDEYILGAKTPKIYRNKWLTEAMVNLDMIDSMGYGINKMSKNQRDRYFPLPDYSKSTNENVILEIYGHEIDINYSKLLIEKKDELTLGEVVLLDKVQKKQFINDESAKKLKQKHLIEGRKPNYYVSLDIAQKTDQKAEYTKNKAFDKQYYLDFIIRAISQHKSLTRRDIDELLWNKLPEWMSNTNRKIKINNLLAELRKNKKIKNTGSLKHSQWIVY